MKYSHPDSSLVNVAALTGCCLLSVPIWLIIFGRAQQQSCVPPTEQPAPNTQPCTSPGVTSLFNSWPQNVSVKVHINANQFTQQEFACLKTVFVNFNSAANGENSSGVLFNVSYSTAAAALNSPYVSGAGNLAVNTPGINFGLQVNRPQGMRPQALGEEYVGTNGSRRSSAVLHLNSNITDCANMQQVLAHEVGHTFGLQDCCNCSRSSTVMNCGVCAQGGTDASGNWGCVRADYNNSSNGRSSLTSCDNTSIRQAGQYDPNTVNQPQCTDADGDGWCAADDCDDGDRFVQTGCPERCVRQTCPAGWSWW